LRLRPAAGAILFAALTASSLVVAAIVLHAKTSKLELEVRTLTRCFEPPHREPLAERSCQGPTSRTVPKVARFAFFVRDSVPTATVELLGADPRNHRTFLSGRPLVAGRVYSFAWTGRADGGGPAPAGKYRLRVALPELDRNIIYPPPVRLVR
jgi:hypothetical protein